MKKIIFKKGEKKITVSWNKFQSKSEIVGLYKADTKNIIFDEEVTEITLDKCDIDQDMRFILSEGQKMNLVNCTSGHYYHDLFIIGGHTNIENGNMGCIRLNIQDGLSTTLNFEEKSNFVGIKILSSKIDIIGNIGSNSMYLSSNTLEFQGSNVESILLHINASQLIVNDCLFYCMGDIDFNYQNLDAEDTYFVPGGGSLNLSKVISGDFLNPSSLKLENVASYDMNKTLKIESLLNEKDQAIASFISVLKGVNKKIENNNLEEIQLISSKIRDSANPRIEALEKQIALLEEEKALLIENTHYNQMKVEELLQNCKIKSIGAKKK